MKIARFRTVGGEIHYGALAEDGSFRLIAGDILGLHAVTDQKVSNLEVEQILAPVDPPNIIALGLNYRAHAAEGGAAAPENPLIFIKATTSVIAPGAPIQLPRSAPNEVDYEAELALIIGKKARCVSEEEALDYVLGYTAANDVSARDCQIRIDRQWARGKSFDTFCPLGPFIQTEQNPNHVSVKSRLNGELMQNGNTEDLIFNCQSLVSYISHQFTLLPGTVILTGTPSGVGAHRNPPVFMREGDTIEVEVEGVGILSNPVQVG